MDTQIKTYSITGSWSGGVYPLFNYTGTQRQALLKCRSIANKCLNNYNSLHGSALLYLDGNVVAGYEYNDNNGYNNRKLKMMSDSSLSNHRM